MTNNHKKKVIVGMSGGVDSSVAAWILKQQGYKVEGLFMNNWEENDEETEYCTEAADLSDAFTVCDDLNIYLHTINFSKEYNGKVFKIFLQKYKSGCTPNPDVLCNKEIKFNTFLKFALKNLQADLIATGHYVRNINTNTNTYLIKGTDKNKDQSYFLHTISHKKLKKCLFPIGTLKKTQVRDIARKLKLKIANKKDSTGICFIAPKNFRKFIQNYIPIQPGNILNTDGNIIGAHQGTSFYTLGQRKGLKIGGIKTGNGQPWYVVDKNTAHNTLIVAQGKNHPRLMSKEFITEKVLWIERKILKYPLYCTVKTRYRQPDIQCCIYPIFKNNLKVILKHPIAAITPGQSAVFYLKERCLGGGIIYKTFPIITV
ncbi:tRNA 2-thiouridine(34) synthase MnmA [Candidatus Blochmannia ocreatus (nom. nud.)]|uniref:tRNA-specific 2-thiouridylase MnmA n=1 Tax=Candidatus Blochmannia ocreatus (nom. nud.) TaxID=251538 RepID=A0ABY4SV06_9ENTR|nr:tRNA 2-thiouridine(34) synthase MnmA [Candidatus Blochmannia ocreatus]URJ24898.1 tRNA 2-thiouridine(34) synthase MnmA [Candidatus Blochmannia ocreatus]